MTVGELVQAKRASYSGMAISAEDDPIRFDPEVVPVLQSLGIWDAEVLEGQIAKGYDEDGTDRFGIAPLDGNLPYCWIGSEDDVVRVIVLPAEEEK